MALAPITINAEREECIDFSKPYMDFSLSLIMQKPGEPPIDNFAFLQPFTGGVWLSTIGVVSAVKRRSSPKQTPLKEVLNGVVVFTVNG